MENNIQEKLDELFKTPRMGHTWYENGQARTLPNTGHNCVIGLYDMVKKHFKPHFTIAELGSFQGTSTRLFALFVKKVYAIDYYDYVVPDTGRIPSHDQTFVDAENTFIERTSHIKNIIKIRKESTIAANDFEDYSLDAVYVDAEHDYESVLADIRAWKNKIKIDGILCGHDFSTAYIPKILKDENLVNQLETYADDSWSVIIKA